MKTCIKELAELKSAILTNTFVHEVNVLGVGGRVAGRGKGKKRNDPRVHGFCFIMKQVTFVFSGRSLSQRRKHRRKYNQECLHVSISNRTCRCPSPISSNLFSPLPRPIDPSPFSLKSRLHYITI